MTPAKLPWFKASPPWNQDATWDGVAEPDGHPSAATAQAILQPASLASYLTLDPTSHPSHRLYLLG